MTIPLKDLLETDDALFHYTKLSTVIEHILPERQLKATWLKDSNDPWEYKKRILSGYIGSAGQGINTGDVIDWYQKAVGRYRLVCFCSARLPEIILEDGNRVRDPTVYRRGWAKSRMWNQYADGHSGACLVFSRKAIENYIGCFGEGHDVAYCQSYERPSPTLVVRPCETLDGACRKHVSDHLADFFGYKSIDYRDETEYRIVIWDPGDEREGPKREYLDVTESMAGVIVGDKCSEAYHPCIESLCKRSQIECCRAHWVGETPGLFPLLPLVEIENRERPNHAKKTLLLSHILEELSHAPCPIGNDPQSGDDRMTSPVAANDEAKAGRILERGEIDSACKWNVEAIYGVGEEWEKDFGRVDGLAAPLEAMRGTLNSAEAIARLFEAETALDRLLERLYTYSHLRADEDTANTENQGRQSRIRAKLTAIAGRLAWITPEILSHSEEELREWTESEALRENRYAMVKLLRRKPHTLSDKEETLLSRAGEVFSAPRQAHSFLTNADMRFPDITGSEGRKRELSQGRFHSFLIDRDRRVRRDAFVAMYDTYGSFKNTLSCTLAHNIKLHNYMAETRHFPSALEASLHDDNVPVVLYEALIAATRAALPHFFQYVSLRRRQLGLGKLDMYDMYVPIVPQYDIKVPFEQAREWVVEACRPLGDEYVAILCSAFTDRWIDIYENRGKRSGAYSGGCYDTMPYVLMNYEGTLDDVFTLAHELGHSMHSWLANHTQPHRFAEYPIFIAEIASTLNEALLLRYMLAATEAGAGDGQFRAYLLNHLCDSYKGTVYRQTMFAEFEKRVHEMDVAGQPLTPDALCDAYGTMNREYYGPEVEADARIALEWSRIPHFYYNFYVYKYATSFCASQIFVRRVLEGGAPLAQYLDLLRAGGSADPLDLVRRAGVDLTDPATLEGAFADFGATVKDLATTLS